MQEFSVFPVDPAYASSDIRDEEKMNELSSSSAKSGVQCLFSGKPKSHKPENQFIV